MTITPGKWIALFGFLFTLLDLSHQYEQQLSDADASSNYYTAAVVEFSPYANIYSASYTLKKNTDAFIEYIEKASKQNADIIVFPEYGLTSENIPGKSQTVDAIDAWTTVVPSPLDEYVPCTGNDPNISEALQRLSCAARKHRIYVVVNLAEKEYCTENHGCSKNATRYYNTNVVFDRTGKIIARYRKVNLFMEFFDTVETPEIVTFDTDFGVTFGTFICFDMLFPVPSLNLTRLHRITDIAYPTAWVSGTPFLTAVQYHSGWSFAEDVNVLTSGLYNPHFGGGGSGIYLGRNGIINATFSRNSAGDLLISRVPKKSKLYEIEEESPKEEGSRRQNPAGISQEEKMDGETTDWINMLHDNVTSAETVRLSNNVFIADTLCHEKFCCNFQVRTRVDQKRSSSLHYRAVVYNGFYSFATQVDAGIRFCAVIQCSDDSIYSCGSVDQPNVTFTDLTIATTLDDYSKVLAVPSILSPSLLPFKGWSYAERANGTRNDLTLSLTKSTNDLVTFGIYVRDFAKDKWHRPHA